MKRIVIASMLILSTMLLFACGNTDISANTTTNGNGQKITEEFQNEVFDYSSNIMSYMDTMDHHKSIWNNDKITVGHFKEYTEAYYEDFSDDVDDYIDYLDEVSFSPSTSTEKEANQLLKDSVKKQKKALKTYQKYLRNQNEKTREKADDLYDEGIADMGDATVEIGLPK